MHTLKPQARDRVLDLRDAGMISVGPMQLTNDAAETDPFSGRIVLSRWAVGGDRGLLGIDLAHEAKHNEQFSGLSGEIRAWRLAISDKLNGGKYREKIEAEAYSYGCASSTDPQAKAIAPRCK